jgi:hypothetical protein
LFATIFDYVTVFDAAKSFQLMHYKTMAEISAESVKKNRLIYTDILRISPTFSKHIFFYLKTVSHLPPRLSLVMQFTIFKLYNSTPTNNN